MGSVNKCIIVGHLGAEPELKKTAAGLSFCNLRIATNERIKDGDGWKEKVEWHRVTVWREAADNAAKYLAKGRQVYIEGRLQTRKYQDKETGADRYSTDIVADRVVFLGGGPGQDNGKDNGKAKHREEQHDPADPHAGDPPPSWM